MGWPVAGGDPGVDGDRLRFEESRIPGVTRITLERIVDERGLFARSWCVDELSAHGIDATLRQCSVSFSERKGTLRGLHWQQPPWEEGKVVRCTRGGIYDVALDLRAGSPTRLQWVGFELTAENRDAVYLPPGVAHGFQTLQDETEVLYMMSERYHPESAAGVRWDDPAFGIAWPLSHPFLSPRDRSYPDFVS